LSCRCLPFPVRSHSMRFVSRLVGRPSLSLATAALMLGVPPGPAAQQPPNPNAAATAADHKDMMEQLGITALRPGPSGNESVANHANYDEALANPYAMLPDPLTLKSGSKVTTPAVWWNERRPEIVEE